MSFRKFLRVEFHLFVLMPVLFVPLALIAGRWELLVIFAGAELYSQSWHEDRHKYDHWRVYVDKGHWRALGAIVAIAGAILLRINR